jgi:hypothetical protein
MKEASARVQIIKEIDDGPKDAQRLCFQKCCYFFGDGTRQEGYRFIWRRKDGSLQAARGQALIPSIEAARKLMDKAVAEGWG